MMMSIYERTKEIGIIKVLGCSLKNIREMFYGNYSADFFRNDDKTGNYKTTKNNTKIDCRRKKR